MNVKVSKVKFYSSAADKKMYIIVKEYNLKNVVNKLYFFNSKQFSKYFPI